MAIKRKDTVTIACSELDKIIDTRNSDLALYYLYRINHPASTTDDACRYLTWTLKRTISVSEELDTLLLKKAAHEDEYPDIPSEEEFLDKNYSVHEVLQLGNIDSEFTNIIDAAKKILGSPAMGREYLKSLFAIYKELHFSSKDVYQILIYLRDTKDHVYASDIRREGYRRSRKKILENTDESLEYIVHDELYFTILKALGYSEKNVPKNVNEYIYNTRKQGFCNTDLLKLASKECKSKIGRLKSSYAIKILTDWKNAGIETIEDYNKKYANKAVNEKYVSKKMLSSIERYSDNPIDALDLDL